MFHIDHIIIWNIYSSYLIRKESALQSDPQNALQSAPKVPPQRVIQSASGLKVNRHGYWILIVLLIYLTVQYKD